MRPICDILEQRVSEALASVAEASAAECPGIVKPTQDAKFGDYQANGVMALAKRLKRNPRQIAQAVVEQLDVSDMCDPPEIAGPRLHQLSSEARLAGPAAHRGCR